MQFDSRCEYTSANASPVSMWAWCKFKTDIKGLPCAFINTADRQEMGESETQQQSPVKMLVSVNHGYVECEGLCIRWEQEIKIVFWGRRIGQTNTGLSPRRRLFVFQFKANDDFTLVLLDTWPYVWKYLFQGSYYESTYGTSQYTRRSENRAALGPATKPDLPVWFLVAGK